MKAKYLFLFKYFFVAVIMLCGCRKLVSISEPVSSITTSKVFQRDDQALSALAGIYSTMAYGGGSLSNNSTTVFGGLSADELINFYTTDLTAMEFQNNALLSTNAFVTNNIWKPAYILIYRANAIIEGLNASSPIQDSIKRELIGQAKFIRAYFYFYLTNFFGEVPLAITSNYDNTALMSRNAVVEVYSQIIADLKDAQKLLASDFSAGSNERIVPNKWAANALLARVYLYTKSWSDAETQSSTIISNNTMFDTVALSSVFSKNSKEAVWQLQANRTRFPYNGTYEGSSFIPFNNTSNPTYYLGNQILNAFETGDLRKVNWVGSSSYNGVTYYYPYKYIIGPAQTVNNGNPLQYYTLLRLSEQYLIRSEARAMQNNLTGAIADINVIRARAGLPLLPNTLTQAQVMASIEQENRIEFFAEWGHRWFDLKRWKRADAVLGPIKGSSWQTTDQLYPIPQSELITDPNLTQNPGY